MREAPINSTTIQMQFNVTKNLPPPQSSTAGAPADNVNQAVADRKSVV